jgi:hypothetical protein
MVREETTLQEGPREGVVEFLEEIATEMWGDCYMSAIKMWTAWLT